MPDEREIRERILKKAQEMFFQFGYTKVTMDEVANELGMSKKTLYKFFPGKEHLIRSMIHNAKCEVNDFVEDLFTKTDVDFVSKLRTLMNFIGQQSNKMRGPLLTDLQKNCPECWEDLNEFRTKHTYQRFTDLVQAGIKAGTFRKDINEEIIVLVYINAMQGVINPATLERLPYTGAQVFEALAKIIFEGILSPEGREKFLSHENSKGGVE